MAAFHDGRVIGAVRGSWNGESARFVPMTHKQWCSITSYTNLDISAKGGQEVKAYFFKSMSSGPFNECWSDAWPCGGIPAAGLYSGTANTLRQFDNTTTGGLYISGLTPGSGQTRSIIGWFGSVTGTSVVNSVILYDRVATYDNGSISASLQSMTNTLAPARYVSSGNEGLLISPTVQTTTALGATASNLSQLLFTDQQGNPSVAIDTTLGLAWKASAAAATATFPSVVACPSLTGQSTSNFPWLPLAANCSGVRQITSYTSSAANTGPVCFALLHPVATMWFQTGVDFRQELSRATFALEPIFSNACLSMLVYTLTGNAENLYGYARIAHA